MSKPIEFHNTPALTREYVKNWVTHLRKDKKASVAEIAILEDVVKLIDVAMQVLQPVPAEPAKDKQ